MSTLPAVTRLSPRRRIAASPRPSFDVYATSIPAGIYTGDFYYYSEVPEAFRLAVGDVAGKGIHAAVFMAMIHEELERLTDCGASTRELTESLNRLLRDQMPRNRFATMAVACIDPLGNATIVNAGHCPVLVRRNSGIVDVIHSHGPALAFFDSSSWRGEGIQLAPGESLLFYTDGLLEARSRQGEEFGLERIIAAYAGASTAVARDTVQTVIRSADEFSGGTRQDDLTVLSVRRPIAA